MRLSDGEVTRKKIHGFLWLAFVCFVNTVPLLIISILANLSSVSVFITHKYISSQLFYEQLTAYVPFLREWKHASKDSFDLVSGVLPPIVSGLFGFFLPIIMRWLTRVCCI